MFLEDSVKGVVEAEGHGRIGLELHPLAIAVEIYAGYHRIFSFLKSLAIDDRSHYRHLHGREFESLCLCLAVCIPEHIVFLLETVEDIFYRGGPIHLICIRKEKGKHIFGSEAITGKKCRVIQGLVNRS